MNYYLLVCGTITYAQRVAAVLRNIGIRHEMLRVPTGLTGAGCEYAVKLAEQNLRTALQYITQQRLTVKRIYAQEHDGYREVSAYDLF